VTVNPFVVLDAVLSEGEIVAAVGKPPWGEALGPSAVQVGHFKEW